MSMQGRFDWIFTFGLTERCPYKSIGNSKSIELKTEIDHDKNTRYVTGFSISIKDFSEEEAKNRAERQARDPYRYHKCEERKVCELLWDRLQYD